MADAAWLQTSFLGGEVAPSFQGRADHPKYKTGLNKNFNALPVETGSWQRRPGTRTAALTRAGLPAKIIDFDFSQNAPYTAEFTDSHLRFFSTYSHVHTFDSGGPEVVQSISTADPAVVTVNGNTQYDNGDYVEFSFPDVDLAPDQCANLNNREFLIGGVSGATFALYDPVNGSPIDGSTLNFVAGTPCLVQRILDIATPWVRQQLDSIRGVQASNNGVNTMVILHPQLPPQALTATDPPNPDFVLAGALFLDGPYLDPPSVGNYIGVSGTSGTITLTASTTFGINSDTGFQPTDVGRSIRLLSQPANWSSGTAYTEGELVTYQGAYYSALQSTTGDVPGADAVNWGVATNANAWVWGIISAVSTDKVVTCELQTVNTATLQLPGVLVNGNNIPDTNYRLGLYSDTTTYPACGTYTEGRLCLGGAAKNRFDMSVSNDIFNFSPTAVDGTVSDNNAIAYTFNAKDLNTIFWMTPQQTGVIMGTQAGEWLVQASTNGDVLTPTSIQAKRVTKYGDANVEPVDAPFATLFVERNNKKVLEYLADVFTGKYSAINVTLTGSHLTAPGVAEIRYQKELAPIMWARMTDGTFAGMTYRRESPMLSEQPAFSGWHSHALGTGRSVTSIAVGPNVTGDLDSLSMVTYDPTDGLYRVELMTDMFPDDGTNLDAWYVDGGTTPAGALLAPTSLTIYGLAIYEGQVLSAYIAGIDCGDFTVTNGEIVIPVPGGNNNSGLLTQAALAAANDLNDFSPSAMPVAYDSADFPVAAATVQSFIGPTTPVTGVQLDTCLIDVPHQRVFMFKQGNTSTDGIRCFNILSGLQTNQVTKEQLYGSNPYNFVYGPYTLGKDGAVYMVNAAANSGSYVKLDPNTLKILGTAGIQSSSFDLAPDAIPFPANLASVRTPGGYTFILAPSLVWDVNSTLNAVEMSDGCVQNAGYAADVSAIFATTDTQALSGPGEDYTGIAFSVGMGSGLDTKGLNFYKTIFLDSAHAFCLKNFPISQNPSISTVRIGSTLFPAGIDATWTHIVSCSAPLYDHSDGNLLFTVYTNDSVTNKQYLMKINAATGAIMWKTGFAAAPHILWSPQYDPTNSYVAFGVFGFWSLAGGVYYLNLCNTATGSITQTATTGFGTQDSNVWDSRLGSTIGVGALSGGAGSPAPLNSTPATFNIQWCRLLLTAAASITTGRQFYIVPACVGTTYTSQGQMLRALDPQSTGARNGPAMGKTRRNHRLAMLLLNSAGIQFGGDFSHLHTALFKSKGGTPYVDNQLFSGVFSDTVEDDYSYDGMLCWQITRPYPANVLAAEPMLQTQDR